LEVNKAYPIPSAANFAYNLRIVTWTGIGSWSTEPAAEYGSEEQGDVISYRKDSNTGKWVKDGTSAYKNWKWYNIENGKLVEVKEDKVQINKPAYQALRALKRVACFSWDMHSYNGSNGAIVVFREGTFLLSKTYIAASPDVPKIDKVKNKEVYYISDLPEKSLSHLVCVFILTCSGPEKAPGTKDMVKQIYSKGANFVGTIIGGDLAERTGWLIAKKFWNYAAKGKKGKGGEWKPVSLPEALKLAYKEVFHSKEYKPFSKGGGYLWPARGGKDDNALKMMGPIP
jgi:hypothetical protein